MLLVVMVNYTISEERQFCRCLGASEAVAKATSASLPTCHGVVLHNQKPHSHKTTFPINHRHYCHLFLAKEVKIKIIRSMCLSHNNVRLLKQIV